MRTFTFPNLMVSLTTFLFLFSISVNAQIAGSLDTTFGSGGIVATHLHIFATLFDMAVQPDKKLIVVGTTFDPMGVVTVGMVARFNENGTLDTSFDGDGFSTVMKEISSVKVLADGKIIVGGYDQVGNTTHFCIARFNSNGSLDSTFDGDGVVQTTVGITSSIKSINVLPNGTILAVGWTALQSTSNHDYALVRYNADGSLDSTFGTGGRVATELGSNEFAYDSAIQRDGKIVVTGDYTDSLSQQKMAAIVRYNADGSIDTTFGNAGKVFRAAATDARASQVAIQADGKIIIVGDNIPPVRYNSDGTLDAAFNSPAWVFTETVTIQPNGKILVGGGNTPNTYVVVRYNINGTPDNSFGTGGVISNSVAPTRISIAPDGKVITGGTRYPEIVLARYINNTIHQGGLTDFDGDSKTDISIFRPAVGEWWINRSSTNQTVAAQFGNSSDRITPGDFTGDGKTDIAIWRPATGEWFVLRSEDSSFFSFPFGANGDIPAPADYDGDGRADAAVFRPSTSTWFVLKSGGGTTIQQFGTAGDKPVVADYDGDGKADIAIFRPSVGEWWYQKSSNNQILAVQFGTGTDEPVQGDYTGDGNADFAFWRPSTGFWFILRSEDLSYFSFPFGTPGDIAAPGDYDGDGKFDAAVFRPSNATWFVQRTTAGTLISTFGSTGDVPVPSAFVP